MVRARASLLALVVAGCFEDAPSVPPGGTTTDAEPTTSTTGTTPSPTTATTDVEPATSTSGTTSPPATTGEPSPTTSTTSGTTTGEDSTAAATSDGSTATTTVVEPECVDVMDCPVAGDECNLPACVDGQCTLDHAPLGTYCNGFEDQCNARGMCIDCVDNGGCGECCVCAGGVCIPA